MSRSVIAVYSGTFDPLTLGHEDVVRRAARMFDQVIIAVATAHHKKTLFTLQERIEMARMADAAAAREQEAARSALEMQHQIGMSAQGKTNAEPSEDAEREAKASGSDRGMEAVGMGLQAIAEVMGRPKQVQRGPNGEVTGIG